MYNVQIPNMLCVYRECQHTPQNVQRARTLDDLSLVHPHGGRLIVDFDERNVSHQS